MATKKDRERAAAKRTSARDWANQQQRGGEATCVNLPEGVDWYKLEVGTHKIDFLPYRVGKNNPRADEGMEHFERSYEAHRVPTPDGTRLYACRKSCFGKRCAVCDWLTKHGGTADQELTKSLRAKPRHLWLINTKPGETKKPDIKVLDTGHYNRGMGFGELMVDAINSLDEGVDPFVLEGGYTAILTVKEQTMPGAKFNAVTRIDLRPHSYDYPDDLLDKLPCLDDMLVDVGYDDVIKLLDPESAAAAEDDSEDERKASKPGKASDPDDEDDDDDDDEDDEPPARSKGGKAKPRSDEDKTAGELGLKVGDIVTHPDYGECEIVRISGDGTSLKLKDDDDEVHSAIAPDSVTKVKVADDDDDDEDDDDEDDDEDDRPATRKGVKSKGKDADEDDDDDDDEEEDDDDDEDDEPPARSKGGKGGKGKR